MLVHCFVGVSVTRLNKGKNLEQKFVLQIGTLNPHGMNERFPFNQFIPIFHVATLQPTA